MAIVNTEGLDPVQVLQALYNASKPQGLGFLHFVEGPLDEEDALSAIADGYGYVDYLKGRVIKVRFDDPEGFNPAMFDRDLGEGAAERAVSAIRPQA